MQCHRIHSSPLSLEGASPQMREIGRLAATLFLDQESQSPLLLECLRSEVTRSVNLWNPYSLHHLRQGATSATTRWVAPRTSHHRPHRCRRLRASSHRQAPTPPTRRQSRCVPTARRYELPVESALRSYSLRVALRNPFPTRRN